MNRLAALLSIVPVCLALTSALTYAQASTGSSVSGSVSDVTGGVVPGATALAGAPHAPEDQVAKAVCEHEPHRAEEEQERQADPYGGGR